ncbi:MAG: A/G-specific adenine glycosylase [Polyangiaceae bacterium]
MSSVSVDATARAAIVTPLVRWYRAVRRDLPWRRTRDPYAVWLSEIMLQQTRVDTVVPYYERFRAKFPTVVALAEAPLESVLAEWSGLGYYRRARMLHAAARAVAESHAGSFPSTAAGLASLPGVGRYTAGAIASIAFGERAPLVDGNVARVLARLFALDADPTRGAGHAQVWSIAEGLVPEDAPGDFNQALMELGATVCVPRTPRCDACPLAAVCRARAEGREGELPRIAPKAPPKGQSLAALVARDERDRILLARRAEGGLFAGLWEPPTLAIGARAPRDPVASFAALVGRAPRTLTLSGRFTHVLTHRRLDVRVYAGRFAARQGAAIGLAERETYDDLRFVDETTLAGLPVSALMRRMLEVAGDGEGEARSRERS